MMSPLLCCKNPGPCHRPPKTSQLQAEPNGNRLCWQLGLRSVLGCGPGAPGQFSNFTGPELSPPTCDPPVVISIAGPTFGPTNRIRIWTQEIQTRASYLAAPARPLSVAGWVCLCFSCFAGPAHSTQMTPKTCFKPHPPPLSTSFPCCFPANPYYSLELVLVSP